MNKAREFIIIEAALESLLDNFMYEPEDYADIDLTEEEIRSLLESTSNAWKEEING